MTCTSVAFASFYSVDRERAGPNAEVCAAVARALNEHLVSDAAEPLCPRRLKLEARASIYGLTSVALVPMQLSARRDLLTQMLVINGRYAVPLDDAAKSRVATVTNRIIDSGSASIYSAKMDPNNSGRVRKVYLLENSACPVESYASAFASVVFVEGVRQSLGPFWGVDYATAGYPFRYIGSIFYAAWESRGRKRDGGEEGKLNIYEAPVDDAAYRAQSKSEGFGLKCSIQSQAGNGGAR
ncbi:hypothetical protein [Dyella sp. 20L07]|uniref:hypothetical protein n=1 Tax=Dyella sp. 20L07 TaxID=3384240 RepID=UPI003D28C0A5